MPREHGRALLLMTRAPPPGERQLQPTPASRAPLCALKVVPEKTSSRAPQVALVSGEAQEAEAGQEQQSQGWCHDCHMPDPVRVLHIQYLVPLRGS